MSAPTREEVAEAMEREANRIAAPGDPSDAQKLIALYEKEG